MPSCQQWLVRLALVQSSRQIAGAFRRSSMDSKRSTGCRPGSPSPFLRRSRQAFHARASSSTLSASLRRRSSADHDVVRDGFRCLPCFNCVAIDAEGAPAPRLGLLGAACLTARSLPARPLWTLRMLPDIERLQIQAESSHRQQQRVEKHALPAARPGFPPANHAAASGLPADRVRWR